MHPEIHIIISILFLAVIWIPVWLIANWVKRFSTNSKSHFFFTLIFFGIYFIGVSIAAWNGLFAEISLPPKIVLLTTLPLLAFLLLIISPSRSFRSILKNSATEDIIRLHIFRFIGGFFLILLFLDHLPKAFALIAGIGDILTAASSYWVASRLEKSPKSGKSIALIWNSFGMLDILITSSLAILFTKWSIESGQLGVEALAYFPFCLIPAFAPATIIFLHISIFRKLLSKKL